MRNSVAITWGLVAWRAFLELDKTICACHHFKGMSWTPVSTQNYMEHESSQDDLVLERGQIQCLWSQNVQMWNQFNPTNWMHGRHPLRVSAANNCKMQCWTRKGWPVQSTVLDSINQLQIDHSIAIFQRFAIHLKSKHSICGISIYAHNTLTPFSTIPMCVNREVSGKWKLGQLLLKHGSATPIVAH